jgi:hypothetical protein
VAPFRGNGQQNQSQNEAFAGGGAQDKAKGPKKKGKRFFGDLMQDSLPNRTKLWVDPSDGRCRCKLALQS